MQKNLSLIIKANQDFIRHTGDDAVVNAPVLNSFYESISSLYIPLLNMLENLEKDSVKCCIGLVLPPILCNMLSDESLQDSYIEWLEKRNQLGLKELERNKDNQQVVQTVQQLIDVNNQRRDEFVEKFSKKLIPAFASYMNKGMIELLGTTGTDIFMPYYADMKEIISAQIECGLHSYRQFFGIVPEGFWLPEFGYTPGVEKLIKAYGYTYTILDSRSVLLAEKAPECGAFYPSRTENSLVIFTRANEIETELYGEDGIIFHEAYRNQNRDIGYNLPMEDLSPFISEGSVRYTTGFKYWNRCFNNQDEAFYNKDAALKQASDDAKVFVQKRKEILDKAAEYLSDKDFVTQVCTFDADKFSLMWDESLLWLENVIREAVDSDISVVSCDKMCENQFSLEKICPYYSAGSGAGYGENLLSSKNCWMMRYIRKACERMVDLSDRFPNDTGLKTRLLNLGAKELMLAQSLRIAKVIDSSDYPEFAERRFKESITAFTMVFDSLGSNTVSTEWLTTLEARDSIFPWMNYRIFTKKR